MSDKKKTGRPRKAEDEKAELVHVRLPKLLRDGIAEHAKREGFVNESEAHRDVVKIGLRERGVIK